LHRNYQITVLNL